MDSTRYIKVILPLKLAWEPYYMVPEGNTVYIGDRVRVAFANREYIGVVCDFVDRPDTDCRKIRNIISVEDSLGRILPKEMELWKMIAGYYLCTVGEVYKAAYPYGKTSLEEARASAVSKVKERRDKLIMSIERKIAQIEVRLEKKNLQIAKARTASTRERYASEADKLEKEIADARMAIHSLLQSSENTARLPLAQNQINLTDAQSEACEKIRNNFAVGNPVLLHGLTGSGKTEIYLQLAYECISSGKDVLYLVPEIALSRQLEERIRSHFADRLMTFHSGESATRRRDVSEALRLGTNKGLIILGTRSSIFLPHNCLGLIIVDEEHESSYKQDSPAPRYNGRDAALMLHRIHGCNIILGSATPSLEELYNCHTGRHSLVELNKRYHGSANPDIELIDTKEERKKRGMAGNFSRRLIDHIRHTLSEKKQVIILRSRRSWAPVMQCEKCGEIVKCPHCNVSLSYHKSASGDRLLCHYCGHNIPYTGRCSKCSGSLISIGAGTQKIEEEALQLFPDARIARLDSDTTQNKTFEKQVIKNFSNGEIDILIGTQIVAKGFDFSNVMLVAAISADAMIGMQDFRADEKALQLLEQFRGRCGRRENKGMFVIQTSQPSHPVYSKLMLYPGISDKSDLLEERRHFNFPPYTRIIEITIKDTDASKTEKMASSLTDRLNKTVGRDKVTGPYAPVTDKIADRYIRCIRISLNKDRNLTKSKEDIADAIMQFEKSCKYDGHITINVDPA